ncbi:MAG: glycosyltransferase family 87 protein [Pirellulaceae bacterium]
MREILFQYDSVNPTTWAYLSSLLVIGLFFKFNRFWSVRNLDVMLLILLAPGLLMVYFGDQNIAAARLAPALDAEMALLDANPMAPDAEAAEEDPAEAAPPTRLELSQRGNALAKAGYIWLFCVSGMLLVRLFLDSTMVRRPLLEPNLTVGGMLFIGCSLFVFLSANIAVSQPSEASLRGVREATKQDPLAVRESLRHYGPGYRLLLMAPGIPTSPLEQHEAPEQQETREAVIIAISKTIAILGNLALVVGIVLVGYFHFDNARMGLGAAMLYLLMPYTALYTGRIDHVLPAAFLIWAIFFYRRPVWAGIFMGLAIGTAYYPLFLLPLWISYYWERGSARFTVGVLAMLAVLALSLIFTSTDFESYMNQFRAMFGLWLPRQGDGFTGFWDYYQNGQDYRIPVLTAFIALAGGLAIWPAQKNLGTLLSCTAAVMLAAQFWHANDGTTYLAWYIPLMLLTIFRPNLEDRVALRVIGEGWRPRKAKNASGDPERKAA